MKIRVFAGSPVEMIGLLDLFPTSPCADVYAFSAMQWGHILSSILRSSFVLNTILSLSFHVSGKGGLLKKRNGAPRGMLYHSNKEFQDIYSKILLLLDFANDVGFHKSVVGRSHRTLLLKAARCSRRCINLIEAYF
jgi:hypothetical protein